MTDDKSPPSDLVERVARAIYDDAHKGLKNCWQWHDFDFESEHPGTRDRYLRYARAALAAIPQGDAPASGELVLDKVYALINPLHGEIDRQTLDMKLPDDAPDDYEVDVLITRKHERDLTAAVLAIEKFQREPAPDVLRITYDRINALGSPDSAEDPNDQFAKGVNHAVDRALTIIDDARRAAPAPQARADNMEAETIERCCKALCHHCRIGRDLIEHKNAACVTVAWMHRWTNEFGTEMGQGCYAATLRALAPSVQDDTGEG